VHGELDPGGTTADSTAGPVLALDLGASRVRAACVASQGRLLSRFDAATPRELGPAAVIDAAIGLLESARDAVAAADSDAIRGVGIAAPGPLDPVSGRLIEPPNLGPAFRDTDLAGPIGAALGLPVRLERDTHVAALAEWEFGAASGCTDFLYVTVSTGIGGAIVSGSRLVGGPDGLAGELGHLVVDLDGPPCGCGGRGHLEAISSGVAIARAASEAIAAGDAPGLAAQQAAGGGRAGAPISARDVAEAEEAGDVAAARIMARARSAWAAASVSLVDVFTPQRIVVGGSIARNQGERWLDPARELVARTAFRLPRERVTIVPAALGDDVGLVGAVPLLRGAGGSAPA
jgi:glucokinase